MSNLLLLLIILFLNIDGLGIWSNSIEIQRILAIALFVTAFFTVKLWEEKWGKSVLVIGVLYFLFLPSQFDVALPVSLAGLLTFANAKGRTKRVFSVGIIGIVLVLAYLKLGISLSPALKNSLDWLSSAIASRLTFGTPMGPSLTGWGAFLFSVAVVMLTCKPWKSLLKRLGIVIGAYLGILNIIAWSLVAVPHVGLQLLWLYPVTQWLALFNVFEQSPGQAVGSPVFGFKKSVTPLICTFLVCTIFAGLYPPQKLPESSPKVTLVNTGFLVNFRAEIPTDEPFGYAAAGAPFAMMPDYLDAFGFQVSIAPSLEDIVWEDTDIVVLINLNEEFDHSFTEELSNYVKSGGALCVVGDHTDIEGTTTKMNALLGGMGIQLNDDTADPILHYQGKLWTNALDFRGGIITRGFKDNTDVQIWGGASLSVSLWTSPIVVGKFGFSDAPDPLNVGYGARLGNRRLEKGERAGDVPLVAIATFGSGRIAVFGDTSPFQLPSTATNWLFMARVFWWLASEDIIPHTKIAKFLAYLLGFATAMVLILWKRTGAPLMLSMSFLLAILAGQQINNLFGQTYDKAILERIDGRRVALIDTSFGEQLDLSLLSPNSGAGLAYNLMRCGFVPVFANCRIIRPAMVFIVAPTKEITIAHVGYLADLVQRGGILFLAAGWESRDVTKNLLAEFSLGIEPVMLGPVPWRNPNLPKTLETEGPDFKEAWPIEILNPQTTTVYYTFHHESSDYVLVTITKKGEGKFVLISDRKFFFSDNLEGELTGKPENVRFFRRLLAAVMEQ